MSQDLFRQNYFWIRRLHSLSGVLPIGGFLLVHLFTNAYSRNPHAFNEHVKQLNETPLVQFIEYGAIIAPIAFHAALGLWMALRMDMNQTQYGNYRNWMYFLQRISGVFVMAFILFHLIHFRIGAEEAFKATHLPMAAHPGAVAVGAPTYDPYRTIAQGLQTSWWIVPFYYAGIITSAFHFANGLWSFCVTWGITIGRRSQLLMSYATMAVFLGISALGCYALGGFLTTHTQ